MTAAIVKTIVSSVCYASYIIPKATTVVIELTEQDVARIRQMAALVKEHGFLRISDHSSCGMWSDADYRCEREDGSNHDDAIYRLETDECSMDSEQLNVWGDSFTITAYEKHGSSGVLESAEIPMDVLDDDSLLYIVGGDEWDD